jgi:hypothetical protein
LTEALLADINVLIVADGGFGDHKLYGDHGGAEVRLFHSFPSAISKSWPPLSKNGLPSTGLAKANASASYAGGRHG